MVTVPVALTAVFARFLGPEMWLLSEFPTPELSILQSYLLSLIFYTFRLALFLTSKSRIARKGFNWPAVDRMNTVSQ